MSFGANAIRAGLAVVELGADLSPLMAGLNKATSALKAYSGQVARLGAGVGGVGAAITAPILAAFRGTVEASADVGLLATQLGLTAERASAFRYALDTVGITEEELISFTRHLNNAFSEAADGSVEAAQSFARLNLDWRELAKLDTVERFLAVKEAIGKINSEADRSKWAGMFFGARRGMELLKFSAQDLRDRMGEAADIGSTYSEQEVANAKEIRRAYQQMTTAIANAYEQVGKALLPQAETIKKYAKVVTDVARVVRVIIDENKELVLGALAIGAAFTAAGTALVAFGIIGGSVAGVVSGLSTAITVLGAVGAAVFSPIGLAIGAVALVVGGLALAYHLADEEQKKFLRTGLFGDLADRWGQVATEGSKAWKTISESGKAAWAGIASALKRGDLSTAWGIVMAEADVVWQQSKASFLSLWDDARDEFLTVADTMALGLQVVLTEAFAAIAKAFADMVGSITARIAGLISALAGTRAAKLAGQSGNLKELADKIGGVGGDDGGIAAWKRRRIEAAQLEFQRAKEARDDARDHDKEMRDADVQMARDRLQGMLDEEKRREKLDAALAARNAGGGGGGFGGVSQAAREVRGTFAGFTSAGAQQALAVGSTAPVRTLVDVNKSQLAELQEIKAELKNGGGEW